MIISFLNQKGGVGKTTLAINIAVALKNKGFSVLLVDSDEQGSARDWHENNNGDVLDVIGLDRVTLDKDVQRFKSQYQFILIDGAPNLSAMASKAIVCSDLVLIPVQPSPYDVWASSNVVDLIKQRQDITGGNPKGFFVVSRQIINTVLSRDVREALKGYDIPVLENYTCQRVIYAATAAKGETVFSLPEGQAASEINAIANEILGITNVDN